MVFLTTYNFLAEISMVHSISDYLYVSDASDSKGGDSMRRNLKVMLDEDVYELLRSASAMEGRAMAEIVREVVRREVRRAKWRKLLPFL